MSQQTLIHYLGCSGSSSRRSDALGLVVRAAVIIQGRAQIVATADEVGRVLVRGFRKGAGTIVRGTHRRRRRWRRKTHIWWGNPHRLQLRLSCLCCLTPAVHANTTDSNGKAAAAVHSTRNETAVHAAAVRCRSNETEATVRPVRHGWWTGVGTHHRGGRGLEAWEGTPLRATVRRGSIRRGVKEGVRAASLGDTALRSANDVTLHTVHSETHPRVAAEVAGILHAAFSCGVTNGCRGGHIAIVVDARRATGTDLTATALASSGVVVGSVLVSGRSGAHGDGSRAHTANNA